MVSEVLGRFDIVGLQEADGGSFRSGQVNQVEYLATHGGFPHHFQQLNRNLGRFAQHSNGLLSRLPPACIEEHQLPGTLPGRGAIHARFGEGPDALHLFVAHLALSHRGRVRQLDYLSEIIQPLRHVVVMGDLNCTPEQLHGHARFCASLPLHPVRPPLSYPSWQPAPRPGPYPALGFARGRRGPRTRPPVLRPPAHRRGYSPAGGLPAGPHPTPQGPPRLTALAADR